MCRPGFNVLHHRQVAEGLHLVGLANEKADLKLPEYDIMDSDSPSLFLSLPDPMREFKVFSGKSLINADKVCRIPVVAADVPVRKDYVPEEKSHSDTHAPPSPAVYAHLQIHLRRSVQLDRRR